MNTLGKMGCALGVCVSLGCASQDQTPADGGGADSGSPDSSNVGLDAGDADAAADAGSQDATPDTTPPPTTAKWDTAWSPASIVTYSNGDLTATGTNSASAAGTGNVRTTIGKSSGKVYWEITVVDGSNGADGIPDEGGVGILESAAPNDSYIGVTDSGLSWGYGTAYYDSYWYTWSGATVNGAPPSGSAVKKGIVYMFALDMDLGEFWAGQDGTWYGAGDPGNGLNPVATGLSGTVYAGATFYAPAASPTGTGNGYVYPTAANSLTANFGASSFAYPVPIGFQAGFY